MATDPRSGTLNITESQSGKATQVNENLAIISALTVGGVASRSIASTPGSPVDGVTHIVPATGVSGAWVGHEKAIAHFQTSKGWRYYTPQQGYKIPVIDELGAEAYFNGLIWVVRPEAEATLTTGGALTLTTGSPFPFDTLPVAEEGVTLVGDTFVVPVEGKYQLSALLSLTGLASANPGTITFFAEINSSNTTILGRGTWQSTTAATLSISISSRPH